MLRPAMIDRLFATDQSWDLLVIGGGATGMGIAVDAASRGYRVALVEQSDFGKGTSSRSTKLIHGGVRYLQQGNIPLVMEALRERGILRSNAPHLVHDLALIVPNYDWWEAPFYGIGMKIYDLLAGRCGFEKSRLLGRQEVLQRIPTLHTDGLRGGVLYYDGQFDDARLLINLAQTAAGQGAVLANYVQAIALTKDAEDYISGAIVRDLESGREAQLRARCIINAAGAFTDAIRRMDDPAAPPLIVPSQGIHIVLDGSFLGRDTAIMVPRTSDGRVMFAMPWHGHALLGTTDTPIPEVSLEPRPLQHEIGFILETAGKYLSRPVMPKDVLSVWAGIRPLAKADNRGRTAALSRDHAIHISGSGLLSISGGKWTTYRHMAEACVNRAITLSRLPGRPCITRTLAIHGHLSEPRRLDDGLAVYGSDATLIADLIRTDTALGERLHPALPIVAAQVVWGARFEMARTVDDILARRTRALHLNAAAAICMAPAVAALLARELGRDETWQREQISEFVAMARSYVLPA